VLVFFLGPGYKKREKVKKRGGGGGGAVPVGPYILCENDANFDLI